MNIKVAAFTESEKSSNISIEAYVLAGYERYNMDIDIKDKKG